MAQLFQRDLLVDVKLQEKWGTRLHNFKLLCTCCNCVPHPKMFYTGQCGTICGSCLDKSFAQQDNMCPICKKQHVRKEYFSINYQGGKVVEKFHAKCPKCDDVTGTFCEVFQHMENLCPSRPVICPACNVQYCMKDKAEHQLSCFQKCRHCKNEQLTSTISEHERECDWRIITCNCGERMTQIMVEQHKATICPNVPVMCPDGCNTLYDRGNMSQHTAVCENVVVECDMCSHQCTRREMAEHKANKELHRQYPIAMEQKQNEKFLLLEQSVDLLKQVTQQLKTREKDDIDAAGVLRNVCEDIKKLMQQNDDAKPVTTEPSQESAATLPPLSTSYFVPAPTWSGMRPGFVFKTDVYGTGYYRDIKSLQFF